jgi:hypothetical protein
MALANQRKKVPPRIVKRPVVEGYTESQCRVCTLPPSILESLDRQRRHWGNSATSLASYFAENLREWVSEGLLPPSTPPISASSFLRHYTNHTTDPYPLQDSRSAQIEVLKEALQQRADLYRQAHILFSRVYSQAERKLSEWEKLLESEQKIRKEYYDHAVETYLEAKQQYLQAVEQATAAGERPPLPPLSSLRMERLPSLPGLVEEEERLLKLLSQIRQYASEASKMMTYEEGFLSYIRVELELFLQETSKALVEGLLKSQNGIALLVPQDKHARLREILRGYLEEQVSGMKTRYREFLRGASQFARSSK